MKQSTIYGRISLHDADSGKSVAAPLEVEFHVVGAGLLSTATPLRFEITKTLTATSLRVTTNIFGAEIKHPPPFAMKFDTIRRGNIATIKPLKVSVEHHEKSDPTLDEVL